MIPPEVASAITVYRDGDADRLRKKYIDAFVDVSGAWYKANIESLRMFSDGLCYSGYLWDCLARKPEVVGLNKINSELASKPYVYVLWDIHSKDRIFIPEYWKFPKRAVVRLDGRLLSDNFSLFPEDIYIFDDTFAWSLIMTHEWIDNSPEKHIYLSCNKE